MTSKGVMYEKSYSRELMRIALEDLEAAKVLFRAKVRRTENVFLLAQQALEKALNALLCSRGLPVPHLHEIGILIDRIPDDLNPPFGNEFNSLTEYATIRRYLEGRECPDQETINEALKSIEAAVVWCGERVKEN